MNRRYGDSAAETALAVRPVAGLPAAPAVRPQAAPATRSNAEPAVRLLPRSALLRTSSIDHPDWNYQPLLARLQRTRFQIIVRLLGDTRHDRLLEVGYGSGVFMPELARRCAHLYGADPHPYADPVRDSLARSGVTAELTRAGAEELPYPDGFFDAVVAVSTLECVPDLDAGCREIRRVLRPGGSLVLVTPGDSPVWNVALRLLTAEGPDGLYGDRRRRLPAVLRRHFQPVDEVAVPRRPAALRLYTGLHLRTPGGGER